MMSINRNIGRSLCSSFALSRNSNYSIGNTVNKRVLGYNYNRSLYACSSNNNIENLISRKFSSNTNSNSNSNADLNVTPQSTDSAPDESSTVSSSESSPGKRSSTLGAYLELSKFRLSSLVVATTGAGFVCSGIYPIDIATATFACVGTAMCAASAGTFNQIIETDRDRAMNRTKNRPLPTGRISMPSAVAFGSATALLGTSMLYTMCNPTVAYLGIANILMYAGLYTYTKQVTEANTWIGAIVGAIPPIMGWAAASGGSILEAEPIALGTLLFLWQFPHFFSLSWMYREDYARGRFQMVACNDPVGDRSANLVMRYSQYLTLFPVVTSVLGLTSYMFLLEGTVVNAYLLYLAKKFKQQHSNANARKIFLTSLWYLPAVLMAYLFHSRTWNRAEDESKKSGIVLDQMSGYMLEAREAMKNLCIHEVFTKPSSNGSDDSSDNNHNSNSNSNNHSNHHNGDSSSSGDNGVSGKPNEGGIAAAFCPKTATDKVIENISSTIRGSSGGGISSDSKKNL